MVGDLVLDLDMTVGRARELFTLALYERAERRFRTSTRISLAFDTALRTVKKIKKRYKDNGVEDGDGPLYNLRRKVYFMLLEQEMDLDEIARCLPINYEVNYARLSVETLMEKGLVVEVERGRGHLAYRGVAPAGILLDLAPSDSEHLLDGFERFLSSLRKLCTQRLLKGNTDTALARRFIVRVRPEDAKELKDELRAILVEKLMEIEQRGEHLEEEELEDFEVLIGLTPA
jgi:predicted transcriptional regulator